MSTPFDVPNFPQVTANTSNININKADIDSLNSSISSQTASLTSLSNTITPRLNANIVELIFPTTQNGINRETTTPMIPVGNGTDGILQGTITMKATGSKIKLTACINCSSSSTSTGARFRFVRGSVSSLSNVISDSIGDADGSRDQSTFGSHYPNSSRGLCVSSLTYIDTPPTYTVGDTFTYSVVVHIQSDRFYINRSDFDDNNNASARTISTFQIEEIFQ